MSAAIEAGDETLTCEGCKATFLFTVAEQEENIKRNYFNKPSMCADCRMNKRASGPGGRSSAGGRVAGGRTGVCNAFVGGECKFGSSCKYIHPGQEQDSRESRPVGPCHAFERGECNRGAACRYRHGEDGPAPMRSGDREEKKPCFSYQKGECDRGANCRYAHEVTGDFSSFGRRSGGGGFAGRGERREGGFSSGEKRPCFAFQKGECDRGDSCRFAHE